MASRQSSRCSQLSISSPAEYRIGTSSFNSRNSRPPEDMPELPVPPAAAPSPSSLLAAFALRTWPALSSANDELPASSLIPTEPDPLPLCSTKVCKSVWPLQPLQFPPGCVQARKACGKIVLVTSEHAHDELNTRMPTVPALVGNTRHQSLATRWQHASSIIGNTHRLSLLHTACSSVTRNTLAKQRQRAKGCGWRGCEGEGAET